MPSSADLARRHAKHAAALALSAAALFAALPREIGAAERRELAARFRFATTPLQAFQEQRTARVRAVHPSLEHVDAWISSVGAAIALADLDQDTLPNEVAYVDTESDLVIVERVPGASASFAALVLDPAPLPFARATMAPMGCTPADLDGDGALDVVVSYWGRTPIAFLQRGALGAPRFEPRELVPGGERWYTNALTTADVDGDGLLDIVVGNYFPDGARVLDAAAEGVESMHSSMSRATNGGRNRVLRCVAHGDALAFEEQPLGIAPELETAWTLALGALDLDGDALPELYVANDFGSDHLLHNRSRPGNVAFAPLRGQRELSATRSTVLGGDSFKGMGVDFADLDGDGAFDIHVTNITTEFGLEESNLVFLSEGAASELAQGVAPFVERSEELGLARSGWVWDARFGDFDGDGVDEVLHATGFLRGDVNRWPELHEAAMGNDQLLHDVRFWHRFSTGDDLSGRQPDRFFVRGSDGRYYDLAQEIGIAQPRVSRGIATADVDGDGDLDFAVAGQWCAPSFVRNDGVQRGRALVLRLLVPVAGASATGARLVDAAVRGSPAIGAIVRVTLPDGRRRLGYVDGGNGHSGERAAEVHMGLGDVAQDARLAVEVEWRSRSGSHERARFDASPGRHTVLLGGGEVAR